MTSKIETDSARKGVGADRDEDGAASMSERKNASFLPTGLSRAVVISALLWAFVMTMTGLLADRYVLVPAPNAENSFMYRLDRVTGAVHFCGAQQCTKVSMKLADN